MRLSITTVEAFRLWRDTGDWMALETLEAQIRREAPQTEKMLRGIAFHAILEHPQACREETPFGVQYRVGARDGTKEFVFAGEGIDLVLTHWPTGGSPEVKSTVDVDGITLVGVADALWANEVYEAKCTEKIDVDNYFESFQWRALLKLYNATVARYVLAQGRDTGGRFIVIDSDGVLPLPIYRYPKLDEDVRRLTLECADFVVKRNLESYVQEQAA